ncbi:MAG: hypothetical protein WCK65_14185 [Rhodospirillaceae bacterium]
MLATVRAKFVKPSDKPARAESEGALIARLGEAVISYWLKERGPLRSS